MPVTSAKTAGAITSAVASVNLRIDTGTLVNSVNVPVPYVGTLTDGILTCPDMTRLTWQVIRLGGTTAVQITPTIGYRRITSPGKFPLEFVQALPTAALPAGGLGVFSLNTVAVEAMSITIDPTGVAVPDPANRFLIFLSASA